MISNDVPSSDNCKNFSDLELEGEKENDGEGGVFSEKMLLYIMTDARVAFLEMSRRRSMISSAFSHLDPPAVAHVHRPCSCR